MLRLVFKMYITIFEEKINQQKLSFNYGQKD